MEKIRLQSIGWHNAVKAKELKPNDVLIWNFGGREKVTSVLPSKNGKTLSIGIQYKNFEGKTVNSRRRLSANTLVATEKVNSTIIKPKL